MLSNDGGGAAEGLERARNEEKKHNCTALKKMILEKVFIVAFNLRLIDIFKENDESFE